MIRYHGHKKFVDSLHCSAFLSQIMCFFEHAKRHGRLSIGRPCLFACGSAHAEPADARRALLAAVHGHEASQAGQSQQRAEEGVEGSAGGAGHGELDAGIVSDYDDICTIFSSI